MKKLNQVHVPAGNSTYCNHVMGLLFEIADYSLHKLSRVPEETSCASRLRQLEKGRVPGEKYTPKSPGYYANCREKTTNKTRDIKYSL